MVKYYISVALLGSISTVFYKQPSCAAASVKNKQEQTPYCRFGKQLKAERLSHHIDNQTFAKKIGISEEQLEAIEAGQKLPCKEQLYKMEDLLSTTLLTE